MMFTISLFIIYYLRLAAGGIDWGKSHQEVKCG